MGKNDTLEMNAINRARRPRRKRRLLVLIFAPLLPLGQSSAVALNGDDSAGDAAIGLPVEQRTDPFAAQFEAVLQPLDAALEEVDMAIPGDAVDLTSFDPPRGPQVLENLGSGVASYYGRRFHGRRTANGERFDMGALTAAHRTLPFGSLVRVTNPRTGANVIVRINDRGPFVGGRTIDLSRAAAEQIGIIAQGHGRVDLELLAP